MKQHTQKEIELWSWLCTLTRCPMCSRKFNGVIKKMPRDEETPFSERFKGEFLFHMKETHGLDPEDVINGLLKRI